MERFPIVILIISKFHWNYFFVVGCLHICQDTGASSHGRWVVNHLPQTDCCMRRLWSCTFITVWNLASPADAFVCLMWPVVHIHSLDYGHFTYEILRLLHSLPTFWISRILHTFPVVTTRIHPAIHTAAISIVIMQFLYNAILVVHCITV